MAAFAIGRTWYVPGDAPTIQAGIDRAAPGDDIVVAPGVYTEHDITMAPGIWLHSGGGADVTIVDAQGLGVGFICSDLASRARIEGFSIVNGHAMGSTEHSGSGGGIRCTSSMLDVGGCRIVNCDADVRGGGVYGYDSEMRLEHCHIGDCTAWVGGGVYVSGFAEWVASTTRIVDCEILGNRASGGGGIVALDREVLIDHCQILGNVASWGEGGGIGCMSPDLSILNCLIAGNASFVINRGDALFIIQSAGVVDGCTIVRNGWTLGSSAVDVGSSGITVDRTIIALNWGWPFLCDGSAIGIGCANVFGNTTGGDICSEDLGGNFSADPLFCDAANGDYTLDWASPCLPGNHPNGIDCGLIGALGAGCGTPPVTGACCFADDTCVVAEPQDCASQGGSYLGDGTDCDPNPCVPTARERTTWGRIRAGYRWDHVGSVRWGASILDRGVEPM